MVWIEQPNRQCDHYMGASALCIGQLCAMPKSEFRLWQPLTWESGLTAPVTTWQGSEVAHADLDSSLVVL